MPFQFMAELGDFSSVAELNEKSRKAILYRLLGEPER